LRAFTRCALIQFEWKWGVVQAVLDRGGDATEGDDPVKTYSVLPWQAAATAAEDSNTTGQQESLSSSSSSLARVD
jgi:hypothetical protein